MTLGELKDELFSICSGNIGTTKNYSIFNTKALHEKPIYESNGLRVTSSCGCLLVKFGDAPDESKYIVSVELLHDPTKRNDKWGNPILSKKISGFKITESDYLLKVKDEFGLTDESEISDIAKCIKKKYLIDEINNLSQTIAKYTRLQNDVIRELSDLRYL